MSTSGAPCRPAGPARHDPRAPPRVRRRRLRAGAAPAARPRLRPHHVGAGHGLAGPLATPSIAPDLLGHGASDKPRADYSLGGYANGMRDLLTVLGIDRVSVVGPQLRRRGGDAVRLPVPRAHRAADAGRLRRSRARGDPGDPGDHHARLPPGDGRCSTLPGVRHVATTAMRRWPAPACGQTRDLGEVADIYDSFKDPHTRAAIRHVVRAVVDWRGQIVTMSDRAYLTETMPMCVVWGRNDLVIPVAPRQQRRRRWRRARGSRSSPTPATSRTRTTRSAS